MSEAGRRIVAIIVAVLMLGGFAVAIIYNAVFTPRNRARVDATLFQPYYAAIAAGRIDEAWERYTTARYKRLHPLPSFREHWQSTLSSKGAIVDKQLYSANSTYELFTGRTSYAVVYHLKLERDFFTLQYTVRQEEDGALRIDYAAYQRQGVPLAEPQPF
jgi:hypothetical protein